MPGPFRKPPTDVDRWAEKILEQILNTRGGNLEETKQRQLGVLRERLVNFAWYLEDEDR